MTHIEKLDRKIERKASELEKRGASVTHEELVDAVALALRRMTIVAREREYQENVPLRERFPDGCAVEVFGRCGTVNWPRHMPSGKDGLVPVMDPDEGLVVWNPATYCRVVDRIDLVDGKPADGEPVRLAFEGVNGGRIEVTLSGVRRVDV